MGFPIGYSDLLLPKLLLNVFLLLSLLRRLISFAFHSFGLSLDDPHHHHHLHHHHHHYYHHQTHVANCPDLKALMQEVLPAAVPYEDRGAPDPAVSCCAVCLRDFSQGEEVRRLVSCRHVFHRWCLDPWIELHQWTCPLCRAPIAASLLPCEPLDAELW